MFKTRHCCTTGTLCSRSLRSSLHSSPIAPSRLLVETSSPIQRHTLSLADRLAGSPTIISHHSEPNRWESHVSALAPRGRALMSYMPVADNHDLLHFSSYARISVAPGEKSRSSCAPMFKSLGLFTARCPDPTCRRPTCFFQHGQSSTPASVRRISSDEKTSGSPAKRKVESTAARSELTKESSSRNGRMTDDVGNVKRSALPLPVDAGIKKPRLEAKGTGSPIDVLGSTKGLAKAVIGAEVSVSPVHMLQFSSIADGSRALHSRSPLCRRL